MYIYACMVHNISHNARKLLLLLLTAFDHIRPNCVNKSSADDVSCFYYLIDMLKYTVYNA